MRFACHFRHPLRPTKTNSPTTPSACTSQKISRSTTCIRLSWNIGSSTNVRIRLPSSERPPDLILDCNELKLPQKHSTYLPPPPRILHLFAIRQVAQGHKVKGGQEPVCGDECIRCAAPRARGPVAINPQMNWSLAGLPSCRASRSPTIW